LRAFVDHGEANRSFDGRIGATAATLRRAAAAGIDLPAIGAQLERDGVRAFCDSCRHLLDAIAAE
jgi:hypothetical protein